MKTIKFNSTHIESGQEPITDFTISGKLSTGLVLLEASKAVEKKTWEDFANTLRESDKKK